MNDTVIAFRWSLSLSHFMQSVGFSLSLSDVPPLLAFSPLDTVHKNKCSDKRFNKIKDCLGCGFEQQPLV